MNPPIVSSLVTVGLLLTSCTSLRFEGVDKVGERYDPNIGAYVVQVRFEVLKGELPVQGLSVFELEMYEDEVRATTESIHELDRDEMKLPVTLLLDTSYSMYRTEAIESVKDAANIFVRGLRNSGFDVDVWSFDSDVRRVQNIDAIPSSWDDREGNSRWTSLYYAVQRVLGANPGGILVVFSDGADNYSQNHGVDSFHDLEPLVTGRQIHAVGFGEVKDEFDRHGNDAVKILRALSSTGTYGYASDEEAIGDVFDYISRRLRNIYFVEYYSPNHAGQHQLEIRYKSARTEPIPFTPERP